MKFQTIWTKNQELLLTGYPADQFRNGSNYKSSELKEFVSSGPNDTQKAEGHLSKVGGTPPLSRFCEKLS